MVEEGGEGAVVAEVGRCVVVGYGRDTEGGASIGAVSVKGRGKGRKVGRREENPPFVPGEDGRGEDPPLISGGVSLLAEYFLVLLPWRRDKLLWMEGFGPRKKGRIFVFQKNVVPLPSRFKGMGKCGKI